MRRWTKNEIALLTPNADLEQLSIKLNRSVYSIQSAYSRYGITHKDDKQKNHWTEDEVQYLITNFEKSDDLKRTRQSLKEIGETLGRPYEGVKKKAVFLGLISQKEFTKHWWSPEEIAIISEGVKQEKTAVQIYEAITHHALKRNGAPHDLKSFRLKLAQLGFKPDWYNRDYFTTADLSYALAISHKAAQVFVSRYRDILKPKPALGGFKGTYNLIKASNFAKLIKTYPGAICDYNVDLLWLIELLV